MSLQKLSLSNHPEESSHATLGVNLRHCIKAWTAHLLEAKQDGYTITKMTPDEVIHMHNMEPVSRKPVTLELASILLAGESRFRKKFTAVALSANEIILYREKSSSAALLTAKRKAEETTGVTGSTGIKSRIKENLGFPKTLLPERSVLRSIAQELKKGTSGKELRNGYTFVVLPPEFMSTKQQEAYKKLSSDARKSYLEYVGDEYIAEIYEEFDLVWDMYESNNGLPEIIFRLARK